MSDVNWWLMALAFVLGLVLTLALTLRRVKREVPVYGALGRRPDVPAASGGAAAKATGGGTAGGATAVADDATTKLPKVSSGDEPTTQLPKVAGAAAAGRLPPVRPGRPSSPPAAVPMKLRTTTPQGPGTM